MQIMALVKPTTMLALLLIVPFLAGGCKGSAPSDPDTELQKGELGHLYEAYFTFVKKNQQPPASVDDLAQFQTIFPFAIKAVQDGKYQVVWGVSSKDSRTVLAYETGAAEKGGMVLMADGKIKKMSAQELQAAAKLK